MALSFFTNTTVGTACGQALTELVSAGYTVNDDLQLRKSGTDTYTSCATQGQRTRQVTFVNEELLTPWTAFTAGIDANSFTVEGDSCAVPPVTDTLALTMGDGCASSFSFSIDGNSVLEVTLTVELLDDATWHD